MGGGEIEQRRKRGWKVGRIGCRGRVQRGGSDTLMTIYIYEKCTSYPIFCLFECYFSAFLNACLLYLEVITIRNELCPTCSLITPLEGLEASF